jgi:hypothetical protein
MIFRFDSLYDGTEREVEVVIREDVATVGPQEAIYAHGFCGASVKAAGEYRRSR